MSYSDFCCWLRGYLDACKSLNDEQVKEISSKLDIVINQMTILPPPSLPPFHVPPIVWPPLNGTTTPVDYATITVENDLHNFGPVSG